MSNFGSNFGQDRFRPQGFGSVPLDYSQAGDVHVVARFFNAVYAWMFAGLGLTAAVAWYVADHTAILQSMGGGAFIGLFIVQIILVGVISAAIYRINAAVATVLFLLYSALNGLTLSVLLLIYAKATLVGAFLGTAGMFGAMSLYGLVTQRDLTRLGSYLFMALIGIILVSVVNMFIGSSGLDWLISYLGVAIFVGLTAYDTQRLRSIALQTAGNEAMASRMSVVGALALYLDFLNLFLFMLQILGGSGNRRR